MRAWSPFFFMIDLVASKEIEKVVLKNLNGSIEKMGFEIIKVNLIEGESALLQIYIDNRNNDVSIDDCGLVSKRISVLLEIEKILSDNYRLEVSSPGIDRPLTKLKHLKNVIGKKISISTFRKFDNKNKFNCELVDFDENNISVKRKNIEDVIAFAEIKDMRLIPEF